MASSRDIEKARQSPVYRTHYEPHLNPQRRASDTQNAIELMIQRMLIEISMNRFKWEGLPEEIDIRWMEMGLLDAALSVFFFDEEYDSYFAMKGSAAGPVNMVGNPTEFIVYGNQYYTKTLKAKDCVPIWANYTRYPDWDIIKIYAHRIATMDRTIEINAMQARHSKVAHVTENTRLSVDNIIAQIERGNPVIKAGTKMNVNDVIDVLDLGVNPDSILNLDIVRGRQWNQAMTMLGVNNNNQDKKERLVAAEVSGNDDMVAAIRATNLQAREQACERINKKYGLDVEVSYVSDAIAEAMATPELKNTNGAPAVSGGDK